MRIDIKYGSSFQTVDIPDNNLIGILKPNKFVFNCSDIDSLKYSIENPINTAKINKIFKVGEKIAIVTSDISRPFPSYLVLPPILDELYSIGVKKNDITIVFALGSHRNHTPKEMIKLVGKRIYNDIRCVDSNPCDFIHMGDTSNGTPVNITRIVAEADRRICLGNIEYHYFAGYSGGAKAIMPGVSTLDAIQSNHSRMVLLGSHAGNLECNPVRDDLEEAIKYCPIDYIVNVILDENKKIIHTVSGHYIDAHRAGCKFLDNIYKKQVSSFADIVIVSQGGEPKDMNLYQTQKALDNAKHVCKEGGIIILVGACKEGMGHQIFEDWMVNSPTPDSIIERIKNDFQLGGHKAASIALILKKSDVFLVSEMQPQYVRKIFMHPFDSVQKALNKAFSIMSNKAKVLVMPYGGSTLPNIKK